VPVIAAVEMVEMVEDVVLVVLPVVDVVVAEAHWQYQLPVDNESRSEIGLYHEDNDCDASEIAG
jgi:hypothetical protein